LKIVACITTRLEFDFAEKKAFLMRKAAQKNEENTFKGKYSPFLYWY
jgi:hypothetical protein